MALYVITFSVFPHTHILRRLDWKTGENILEGLRSKKGDHGFYRSETIPVDASQSHYKLHNDAIGKAAKKEL